jgi:site-specific DNA recombinase
MSINDSTAAIRAAGYVRVSTARQVEKGWSFEDQAERVRKFAEAQGWEWIDLYAEPAISGKRDDRPQLARAMADAKAGKFDRLIVPAISRFGRNARHNLALYDDLDAAGVGLVSLAESFDTTTAAGRFVRLMLTGQAQMESEQIGERVALTAAARARAGKHHGRHPFGYRKGPDGGLIPHDREAPIVRRIFAEYAAGKSQRGIARALNADGIATQRGGEWSQPAVRKVLANPFYRGSVVFNGEEHPGEHEPIVSDDLWRQAEARRARTTRTPNGGPIAGRPPAGRHLFTRGLLRCGHCGSAMGTRTAVGRDRYERYVCLGRLNHGTDHCPQTLIPREAIDKAALAYFEAVALDVEATKREVKAAVKREAGEVEAAVAEAEREEREAAEAVERVRRDYTAGEITAADWRELRPDLESEHEAARANLDQVRARRDALAPAAAERVEAQTVERLRKLREAVAGKIESAPDLTAVRGALLDLFDRFEVKRLDVLNAERAAAGEVERQAMADVLASIGEDVDTFEADGWIIAPFPRDEAFDWGSAVPVLSRVPLPANRETERLTM